MSCSISIFPPQGRRATNRRAARGAREAGGEDALRIEVMGTWDFKWPLDTVIRVAFQPPRNNEGFEEAKKAIRRIAEQWLQKSPGISFAWVDPKLFEAAEGNGGRGRSDDDDVDDDRSPFVVPNDPRKYRDSDYDILISLDPLSTLKRKLWFPKSELGSFARRVDFGTPTMFIGPPNENATLAGYYQTPLAQFYVCHEFGHALGLAHEHQNPYLRRTDGALDEALRDAKNLEERLRKEWTRCHGINAADLEREGLNVQGLIADEISEVWPGNTKFSDWREYSSYDQGRALGSVMMMPYLARLVKDHTCSDADCKGCAEDHLALGPTAEDLAQLAAMYPQPEQNERKESRSIVLNL